MPLSRLGEKARPARSGGIRSLGTASLLVLLTLGLFSVFLAAVPSSVQDAHAQSLGGWTPTTAYPFAPGSVSCAISGGYIYCVGGETILSNAYYATISASGIGTWHNTTSYPVNFAEGGITSTSCAISGGYLYCVGGHTVGSGNSAIDSVYYAPVSSSGIGTWITTIAYPLMVNSDSCTISSGYIYCVGGATNGPITSAVYYATVSPTGVGPWVTTTSYPIDIYTQTCTISGTYLYCVGGDTESTTGVIGAVDTVYYAQISAAGVGAWTATTSYPATVGGQACTMSADSYLYCVGGYMPLSSTGDIDNVYYAQASSSGIGAWTAATSYPVGISSGDSGGCYVSDDYIYCISLSGYVDSSYYADIAPSTSQLTIVTTDTSNQIIRGYFTVLYQGGTVVATGSSPTPFTLNDGQSYVLQVDDYGSCHFDHWADTGSTSASRAISISAATELTAVYDCAGTGSASSVTVNSVDQNGNAIFGYYTTLSQSGTTVATGFTTKTFSTTAGQTYGVQVDDYGSCAFARWADGATNDPRSVTATSGPLSLTAVYDCGGSSTPPPAGTSIAVSTVNSGGGSITGYYVTLWQDGQQVVSCFSACSFAVNGGQTYQVTASSYGSETFSHWQDGATGMETVNVPATGTMTVQLTATYSP